MAMCIAPELDARGNLERSSTLIIDSILVDFGKLGSFGVMETTLDYRAVSCCSYEAVVGNSDKLKMARVTCPTCKTAGTSRRRVVVQRSVEAAWLGLLP